MKEVMVNMSAKKEFLIKILTKVLIGFLFFMALDIIEDFPVIRAMQDQIALGQMKTSGIAYAIMSSLDIFIRGVKRAINIIVCVMIGIDIYNYTNKDKE